MRMTRFRLAQLQGIAERYPEPGLRDWSAIVFIGICRDSQPQSSTIRSI